jgi:glycosyltransferase involved in cell wall biosynthesis
MPDVSVVVPVRDRVHPDLLASLDAQCYTTWEFIHIRGRMPIGQARQMGVDAARGRYVAFIDADCVLSSHVWLNQMVKGIIGNVAMTWAPGIVPDDSPWINRYALRTHPLTHPPEIITRENYVPVGTGHCVIRKDAIDLIGGFKPLAAGEDVDLTRRLVDAGFSLRFVPHGVYHYHVASLREYYRKYYRNIRAARDNPPWREENIERRPPLIDTFLSAPRRGWSLFIEERDPRWLLHPLITGMKAPIALAAMWV